MLALLQYGAPVDARSNGGQTALHWAAGHSQVAVVRLLLLSGADAGARDKYGKMPLSDSAEITALLTLSKYLTRLAELHGDVTRWYHVAATLALFISYVAIFAEALVECGVLLALPTIALTWWCVEKLGIVVIAAIATVLAILCARNPHRRPPPAVINQYRQSPAAAP